VAGHVLDQLDVALHRHVAVLPSVVIIDAAPDSRPQSAGAPTTAAAVREIRIRSQDMLSLRKRKLKAGDSVAIIGRDVARCHADVWRRSGKGEFEDLQRQSRLLRRRGSEARVDSAPWRGWLPGLGSNQRPFD
jgi:hypothetical protein